MNLLRQHHKESLEFCQGNRTKKAPNKPMMLKTSLGLLIQSRISPETGASEGAAFGHSFLGPARWWTRRADSLLQNFPGLLAIGPSQTSTLVSHEPKECPRA